MLEIAEGSLQLFVRPLGCPPKRLFLDFLVTLSQIPVIPQNAVDCISKCFLGAALSSTLATRRKDLGLCIHREPIALHVHLEVVLEGIQLDRLLTKVVACESLVHLTSQ